MKKFLSVLVLALALIIGTNTNVFAKETNTSNLSQVVTPASVRVQQTFKKNYWQQSTETLKLWGLTIGNVTVEIPATYAETWITDGNGNKIEFISSSTYFDTSRQMDIISYSSAPLTSVTITSYSFTSSVATIKYSATTSKNGTSASTINVYPSPYPYGL